MFLFLTYYFQINLGYSPLKAGFAFLPFSAGIIITAGVVAQVLPRVGPKPLIVGGLVLAAAGMLWLTQITADTSYWTHVFPSEVLMSVGLAGVFIPASSTALIGVGHHDAGVASAVLNTAQQIGGSLGTALLNTLFAGAVTAYLTDNLTDPANAEAVGQSALIHGYHVAFFWGAMLLLAASWSRARDQRQEAGRPDRARDGCRLTRSLRRAPQVLPQLRHGRKLGNGFILQLKDWRIPMPDQPTDTPPQPDPDDQPTAVISQPEASEPKEPWAKQPLHLTRAVATGIAAGILLVGGVAGLAIGVTLANSDSDGDGPHRTGWHVERGDRGDMPERGQRDWREHGPPPGFEQGGPDYYFNPETPEGPELDGQTPSGDEPTPTDPSDSTT